MCNKTDNNLEAVREERKGQGGGVEKNLCVPCGECVDKVVMVF